MHTFQYQTFIPVNLSSWCLEQFWTPFKNVSLLTWIHLAELRIKIESRTKFYGKKKHCYIVDNSLSSTIYKELQKPSTSIKELKLQKIATKFCSSQSHPVILKKKVSLLGRGGHSWNAFDHKTTWSGHSWSKTTTMISSEHNQQVKIHSFLFKAFNFEINKQFKQCIGVFVLINMFSFCFFLLFCFFFISINTALIISCRIQLHRFQCFF